jgi:hypothetical protein
MGNLILSHENFCAEVDQELLPAADLENLSSSS